MNTGIRRRLIINCVLSVTAIYCVFVLTRWGQRVDNAAKVHITVRRYSRRGIFSVRHLTAAIPIGAAVITTATIARWASKRPLRTLLAVVSVVAPPVLISKVLKLILPHPSLTKYPAWIAGSTLPSGHVAFVTGLSLCCFLLMPHRHRFNGGLLCAAMPLAMMLGVIIDGSHRPSDAVASVGVVLAWFLCIAPRVTSIRKRSDHATARTFVRTAMVFGACSIAVYRTPAFDDFPPTVSAVDRAFAGAVLLAGAASLMFHHVITTHFSSMTLSFTMPERESGVPRSGLTTK